MLFRTTSRQGLAARHISPFFDKEAKRWITLRLEEYLKKVPGRRGLLSKGVLQLLASSTEVWWHDTHGLVEGCRNFQSPNMLQAGTASVLHAAIEGPGCHWSYASRRELAQQVPFVICCEVPDFCSSNQRKCMQGSMDMSSQKICCIGKDGVVLTNVIVASRMWRKTFQIRLLLMIWR